MAFKCQYDQCHFQEHCIFTLPKLLGPWHPKRLFTRSGYMKKARKYCYLRAFIYLTRLASGAFLSIAWHKHLAAVAWLGK